MIRALRFRQMMRHIRVAGYFCTFCGKKMAVEERTIEHLIPKSRGGSNRRANLTRSCKSYNSARGNDAHVLPVFCTTTGQRLTIAERNSLMDAANSVRKVQAPDG